MNEFVGYPRTAHLVGSGLQKGDDGKAMVSFQSLKGHHAVVEEKVDGANAAFSFDAAGDRVLQSRGTILSHDRSVWRERHFNLFKLWTELNQDRFLERLEDRYIVYGEWMGAVHSVFYDHLPHLFLEFDVWDKQEQVFLSTQARRELLTGLDISSVPVLYEGEIESQVHLRTYIDKTIFRTDKWENSLQRACNMVNDNFETRLSRMFKHDTSEGLYIKIERDGKTVDRMKWVEPGFVQTILDSSIHWQSTYVVPNILGRSVIDFPHGLVRQGAMEADYNPDQPNDWKKIIEENHFHL